MVTKTLDLTEAQTRLKDLLAKSGKDFEFVLTDNDKPVARIVPMGKRISGLHRGKIKPGKDFNDELPDVFWTGSANKK
jgi:antitoxin (DNA-binding transcriptional repressor) of toxin-antitoxin stability system